MSINYYAVPKIGSGTKADPFRAKYIAGQGFAFISMDLGKEPWFIVRADTDSTQDASIAGQIDAFRIPQPLTNTIATIQVLNAVKNALETMNLPGGWITVSNTFLEVLRATSWLAQFLQILDGLGIDQIFGGGVTLSSTFGSLSLTMRNALQTAASQMTLDVTGITGSTTLRVIFTNFIAQFILRPITIEV